MAHTRTALALLAAFPLAACSALPAATSRGPIGRDAAVEEGSAEGGQDADADTSDASDASIVAHRASLRAAIAEAPALAAPPSAPAVVPVPLRLSRAQVRLALAGALLHPFDDPDAPVPVPADARHEVVRFATGHSFDVARSASGHDLWVSRSAADGTSVTDHFALTGDAFPEHAAWRLVPVYDLGPGVGAALVVDAPPQAWTLPDVAGGHPLPARLVRAPSASDRRDDDAALSETTALRYMRPCPRGAGRCLLFGDMGDVERAADPSPVVRGGWRLFRSRTLTHGPAQPPAAVDPRFAGQGSLRDLEIVVGPQDARPVIADDTGNPAPQPIGVWLVRGGRTSYLFGFVEGGFEATTGGITTDSEGRPIAWLWQAWDTSVRFARFDRGTGQLIGAPVAVRADFDPEPECANVYSSTRPLIVESGDRLLVGLAWAFDDRVIVFDLGDRAGHFVRARLPATSIETDELDATTALPPLLRRTTRVPGGPAVVVVP